jgi:hypothetical protein
MRLFDILVAHETEGPCVVIPVDNNRVPRTGMVFRASPELVPSELDEEGK